MNAEMEPLPQDDGYAIDFDMDCDGGGNDGNDIEDLTPEDRTAINACKGLRRQKTIIEDLRPDDTSKLEYSYRPLDNINQFWAGPSYWKFRKSRKLTINKDSTESTDASSKAVAAAQAQKRRSQKKKLETIPIIQLYDANEDNGIFISINSKMAEKLKKGNWQKRWDPKKLKLPTDLQIDRTLFNHYEYCPSLTVKSSEPKVVPQINAGGYNYDNVDDREYCSNVVCVYSYFFIFLKLQIIYIDILLICLNFVQPVDEMDRDTDPEIDTETNVPEENQMQMDELPADNPNDNTVMEIGQNYEGAPDMVKY